MNRKALTDAQSALVAAIETKPARAFELVRNMSREDRLRLGLGAWRLYAVANFGLDGIGQQELRLAIEREQQAIDLANEMEEHRGTSEASGAASGVEAGGGEDSRGPG